MRTLAGIFAKCHAEWKSLNKNACSTMDRNARRSAQMGKRMIIIHVVGGFGNQLYCYAIYEKIKDLGKEVKLDIGDYLPGAAEPEKRRLELPFLEDLAYEVCTPEERKALKDDGRAFWERVRRKLFGSRASIFREPDRYSPHIFEMSHVYLDGYWNSEAYIADRIPALQEKISFPKGSLKNREYAEKMQEEEAVFLHVRRSDYLEPACVDRYRDICTEAYYRGALDYVRGIWKSTGEKPLKIYIFSDDTEYVKETYKDLGAEVIDWNQGEESFYDCMLMSRCKYHICANSTFSMWAARLCSRPEKVMIRPLLFDRYQNITPEEIRQEWAGWVLIDDKGSVYAD